MSYCDLAGITSALQFHPIVKNQAILPNINSNQANCFGTCDDLETSCEGTFIYGCTSELADNYNPDANVDDGSCFCESYIEFYLEMHRYIPVLAKNAGFTNITEKVVKHQARKYGTTKFGAERFINGFLDLITIWFLSRFAKRPMHLFGALGVLMFIIGSCSAIYIGISKLYKLAQGLPAILVTNNPWFYIALTTMIIGTQLFLAGFLGELILRSKRQQERYRIAETIA